MLKQKLWKVKLHVCIKGAVHIRSSPHHRLSCGQILEMTDCHVENFSTWEMWRKFVMWRNNVYNLWRFLAFYAVLLRNRDLRSFVAISVLLRITRFCVEKIQPRIAPVEKKLLISGMIFTSSSTHAPLPSSKVWPLALKQICYWLSQRARVSSSKLCNPADQQ